MPDIYYDPRAPRVIGQPEKKKETPMQRELQQRRAERAQEHAARDEAERQAQEAARNEQSSRQAALLAKKERREQAEQLERMTPAEVGEFTRLKQDKFNNLVVRAYSMVDEKFEAENERLRAEEERALKLSKQVTSIADWNRQRDRIIENMNARSDARAALRAERQLQAEAFDDPTERMIAGLDNDERAALLSLLDGFSDTPALMEQAKQNLYQQSIEVLEAEYLKELEAVPTVGRYFDRITAQTKVKEKYAALGVDVNAVKSPNSLKRTA